MRETVLVVLIGTLWMVAQVDYGESGLYEWPEGGSPGLRYRPTEPNHWLTGTLAIVP